MRLRRFSGPSTSAVLRDVKRALGDDALILATRELSGGGIEITAATDAEQVVRPLPEEPPPQPVALAVNDGRLDAIEDMLRGFGTQLRRVDRRLGAARHGMAESALSSERLAALPSEPRQLSETLSEHGLPGPLAATIGERFASRRAQGVTFDDALAAAVTDCLPLVEGTRAANVRFLVGPTGSGKTTTIAKLAAEDVLAGGERPILLMGDTVRIGAAEQLGGFARILDLPVHVVQTADDLRRRVEEAPADAPVYVDTSGLSSDESIGRAIREMVETCDGSAGVTAVVSATAAGSSLHRAREQLEGLRPDSCAVTHMDESDEPGIACSWVEEVGLPLWWLGTGQRVPDDLAPATGANLALWLVAA